MCYTRDMTKSLSELELKEVLRIQVMAAGGVRPLARRFGITPSVISHTLCRPAQRPIAVLLRAMGYRQTETRYEKID